MKRWIKFPQPRQFRGEGKWEEVTPDTEEYYEYCKATGYLPTVEQDEVPSDENNDQ